MSLVIVIGTAKGGFLLRSDANRQRWNIEGPLFKGWKVTSAARLPGGDFLLATASDVYGCAIHKSRDLAQWRQISDGPRYAAGSKRELSQVWKLVAHNDISYAGVSDAGLFRSDDQGESWTPVPGLNEHRTRNAWAPGAGGLCAHAILVDRAHPQRLWCGISAVGVMRSDDGGQTWQGKNSGVPVALQDKEFDEIGFCVHGLAQDPHDANVIYRQDHLGVFRTTDGGDHWERIQNGLESGFGFPMVLDARTRSLYIVPLESDEYRIPSAGRFRVFRSTNGGDSWEPLMRGLPQQNAYFGVLRGALDVDNLDPCGVYVGNDFRRRLRLERPRRQLDNAALPASAHPLGDRVPGGLGSEVKSQI
jgi:photosystem II stability/assembly factor-like uncharacterized protein